MSLKSSIIFNIILFLLLAGGVYYMHLSIYSLLLPLFIQLYILVSGSIFIQKNVYLKSIHALEYSEPSIALTFDDGIHPEFTPKVLGILKHYDIKATFFVIGKNIKGNESILKQMHDEGHCIGNHSYEHSFWYSIKSAKNMATDIKKTNQLIQAITGKPCKLFRPPYGVTNPNVAGAVRISNMMSVGWCVRSLDTIAKNKEDLLRKLKRKTKPGSIILLHDTCSITVDVLENFIQHILQQGWNFVTVCNYVEKMNNSHTD